MQIIYKFKEEKYLENGFAMRLKQLGKWLMKRYGFNSATMNVSYLNDDTDEMIVKFTLIKK